MRARKPSNPAPKVAPRRSVAAVRLPAIAVPRKSAAERGNTATLKLPASPIGTSSSQLGGRRGSLRKIPSRRDDSRQKAASTIQRWYRASRMRRNLTAVIDAARAWAVAEERLNKERVAKAKTILSGFFWKCHATLQRRRREALRRLRIKAAELIHRLLLAKRSEFRVAAKGSLRMTQAALIILQRWRGSPMFAKVRWRRQNEEMILLLEREEEIERRDVLRLERWDHSQVFEAFSSDPVVGSTARLDDDFHSRALWIQAQQEDVHHQIMQEALFGAPSASSVTTIKRQQLSERNDSLRANSSATGWNLLRGSVARASDSSSLTPSHAASPMAIVALWQKQAASSSLRRPTVAATGEERASWATVSPLMSATSRVPRAAPQMNAGERATHNAKAVFLHPQFAAGRRHIDALVDANDPSATIFKNGVSRTWLGGAWSDWFALADLSPSGVEAQERTVLEAEQSAAFNPLVAELSNVRFKSVKQQRRVEELKADGSYFGVDVLHLDYEVERTLIQEFSRRKRLEDQFLKLWIALQHEQRIELQHAIVSSFILSAGGATLTAPFDDDHDMYPPE